MSPRYYLAFDLGASSGRAILGTLHDDRLEIAEVHRFETPIVEVGDDLYWDIDALEEQLHAGLRTAMEQAPGLRSLSVDSWAVDVVPIGADGRALRNPHSYRSPRNAGWMERAFRIMSRKELYAVTGIQFMRFNTLYQMMSQLDFEPETFQEAVTWLTIADYFNYRFSGKAVMDVSMASTTQMMNVRTRNWSDTILSQFGIPREQWPVIIRPGSRLGPCSDMPRVQVVSSCSHDTGAAVAAVPADESGPPWAYISSGTWSLLGIERTDPILSDEAREAGFTNEAGIDATVRFLKNLSGLWALQECMREWHESGDGIDYGTAIDEARSARSLGGVVDLELDRFYERGDMESRLRSYCGETGIAEPSTRGELVRLILESIADSFARSLADLDEIAGVRHEVVHIVGGGSQNGLLCQLAANASGRTVVAGPSEATALGNLAIQARTMGDLEGDLTIRSLIRNSTDLRNYQPERTKLNEE